MVEIGAQRPDRIWHLLGSLAVLIFIGWFATWTGVGQGNAIGDALAVIGSSLPWVLAWLAAAVGYGWPLRLLLARQAEEALCIQIGLGVAAMLTLDETLGALGVLQYGGAIGAWMLIAAGLALLIAQVVSNRRTQIRFPFAPWLMWMAAPAIAVLLLASCSAPGWLWATEFGGYDALSYHLALPREWLAIGRIQPLDHNVYSFLPGYVEAAYYHLAVLVGDGVRSVYACQMLHAAFTLLTAVMVGRFTARLGGPVIGAAAFVIFLGTPWMIVVGSLGYNEMAVTLMLATGLLIVRETSLHAWQRGATIGFVAAAACSAKLTAVGLVALPLAILMLIHISPRNWIKAVVAGTVAGFVVLSPYLLRNQLSAGNPVFPFASDILGLGHWTAEQRTTFAHGHITDADMSHRLVEFWNQFLRYGIGANPYSNEPWKAQWSILPWIGLIGFALGFTSRKLRRWAVMLAIVLLAQIVFWLLFTHLKSRFLLPTAVPLAIGVALGATALAERFNRQSQSRSASIILAVALVAWSALPVFIFHGERDGAPAALVDRAGQLTGDDLTPQERIEAGQNFAPAVAINYLLPEPLLDSHIGLSPISSRVLLLGEAKPLYYRLDRIAYQTTWDRGPLSALMREFPDQPEKRARSLRKEGFTHLLVDETMLEIWEKSGWNDPLITRRRVTDFAQHYGTVLYRYPNGVTLYALRR